MKRIKVSFEMIVMDDYEMKPMPILTKRLALWAETKCGSVHLVDGMADTLTYEEMK